MPTFIAFQKGQKIKEVVGANPAALQVRIEYIVRIDPEAD